MDVQGPAASASGTLLGVQCSAHLSHDLGVDPIQNLLYVPARLFPVDGASGQPGILLFWDSAPPGQPPATSSAARFEAGGGGPKGGVLMTLSGRAIRADATKNAACNGILLGDPLVGGTAMLAVDGAPAAQGPIAAQ